jgi:hypothetical protein
MSGVDFTDKFFQQTIQKLSANNSLFFSSRQLYYCFNERRDSKKVDQLKAAAGCSIATAVVLSIIIAVGWGLPMLSVVLLLLVIPISIAVLVSASLRKKLRGVKPIPLNATPEQVESWYRRWCKINGDVPKLLPPMSSTTASNPTATAISPELRQYSFDRAVICDRAEVARFLIANNFHFENNSAVLSVDGYPGDIFDTVMNMLRRNPNLHVYALHDCSKRGVELSSILRTEPRWFAGTTAKIYDLGLLPRQIFDRRVSVEKEPPGARQSLNPSISATLQPEEVGWLVEGNFVALDSFPPQTLLRIITRGIAKSRDPQAQDALEPVVWFDGGPGIYYYGAESFG